MGKRTAAQEAKLGQLRAAYEGAFRELASRVGTWQTLAQQVVGNNSAVEHERKRVDQALAAYRQSRDSLVDFILASREDKIAAAKPNAKAAAASADGSGGAVADKRAALRPQVEALAHELWERKGRPIGNPEADWYHAEQMVLQGHGAFMR